VEEDYLMVMTRLRRSLLKYWELYLLELPVLAFFIIFHYIPMYGVQIAFKNFIPTLGIWGSPWVGLNHLIRFFESFYIERLLTNTIGISLYSMLVSFPAPILLALMINEMRNRYFKKAIQTITYMPHFLSTVVAVGIIFMILSPRSGIVNQAIKAFGGEAISFMTEPSYFKTIYVLSGVWQSAGFGSIIYMAALSNIDVELYSAAMVDGASRFQRLIYITIPSLIPTITILFILNMGSIMNVGFEKVYLMQNELNMASSDVISTFVYRNGVLGAQFSFSAAVGLFNSVINLILLTSVNQISRRLGETSLW
jgi:putative aldouronate transport system permease protein